MFGRMFIASTEWKIRNLEGHRGPSYSMSSDLLSCNTARRRLCLNSLAGHNSR